MDDGLRFSVVLTGPFAAAVAIGVSMIATPAAHAGSDWYAPRHVGVDADVPSTTTTRGVDGGTGGGSRTGGPATRLGSDWY